MSNMRAAIAIDPLRFGRRVRAAPVNAAKSESFGNDVRLFAMTFAAGFLFVSIFLG